MDGMVVMYTAVGLGHLTPMVELAKLLLPHGLSSTIVVPSQALAASPAIDAFTSRVTSVHPAISFHRLPPVPLPDGTPSSSRTFNTLLFSNPLLLDFIRSLTVPVRVLVLDFFCTHALDVAAELRLPCFFFFSTAAANLAAFLHLPTLHSSTSASFRDLAADNKLVHFPGLPPTAASEMPRELQDRNADSYKGIMFHLGRLPRARGILVNTFSALEERALRAIADGLCVPGCPAPRVLCIGPLVAGVLADEKHECLSWLDRQPCGSVVFLCFGSLGVFPIVQLREIAVGLEQSGLRFLWVVRSPSGDNGSTLLPDGFLERTKERGMVVELLAPQAAVLNHKAVGGFVTHCGWNSVLESVCTGVPMIAWPLYAEQRMNKVYLVEEMGLAVEMKGYDKEVVAAEEVEEKIRWLMESEGGAELRERAVKAKESAVAALGEGGSSHSVFMEFVGEVKRGLKLVDE